MYKKKAIYLSCLERSKNLFLNSLMKSILLDNCEWECIQFSKMFHTLLIDKVVCPKIIILLDLNCYIQKYLKQQILFIMQFLFVETKFPKSK